MCLKSKFNSEFGFSLIEVVVVAGITALLVSFMVVNFPRTRLDLDETTNVIIAEIRSTQARAVSGNQYSGHVRCGYGIHYETTTSYSIYTGPDSQATTCSTQNRNFDGSDSKIRIINLISSKLEFKNTPPFKDIFFEPPNPNVFIDGSWSLQSSQPITIGKKNTTCSSTTCKTICVYASGKIETLSGLVSCPL